MALRNKDGTLYKLEGPNPVMKDQKIWGDYTVHNMKWESEKKADTTPKVEIPKKETFIEELERTKEVIPEVIQEEIKIVETVPEVVEIKEIVKDENEIEKSFIYCLPAFIKEKKDTLYNETYKTIQYGSPTSFEGVIISQTDLSIQIWTNVNGINEGSILYPKTNFKRWWRVQNKENKTGGWIIDGVISDFQPSFDN